MEIKLVSPRMSLRPMDSEYKRRLSPSIGLLTVAGLTPAGHAVSLEDENAGDDVMGGRPGLVGVTVNVDTSRRAYEIAGAWRARGVPVVLGGIHPSAVPDEALRHADAVCVGEAEGVWERIVGDAGRGALAGRYEAAAPAGELRSPPPRWELLDRARYLYTNIVCSSRGCPHRCDFCYNSCAYRRARLRLRPVADIVAEIERLGTRHVMFIDDNFAGDPRRARALVEAMLPMGLQWNAAVSADIVCHPDLLDAMRASGCRSLFIGFESINEGSLAWANKRHARVALYERLAHELHQRGILVNASMAFGFDDDTPRVFPETLDWLVGLRVASMTAHILTPSPGTVLYRRLLAEGRIVDFDWSHYNTARAVFRPARMTAEELERGYLWIYDEFYSMKSIMRRLPDDRSQWAPFMLFNLGYRKLGRLTAGIAGLGFMNLVGRTARRLAYGID